MSTISFSNGKTVEFNGTPTPEDIDYVAKQIGITPDNAAPDAPEKTGLIPLIPQLGPIAPASPNDRGFTAGLKTAANVIPSAINAVTGLANASIQGLTHIQDIPGMAKEAWDANHQTIPGPGGTETNNATIPGDPNSLSPGGKLPTNAFIKNIIGGLGETLIPEGTRKLEQGDTRGAATSVTNDPVGNILPYILLGREAAYKVSPSAGAAFDSAVSRTAAPALPLVEKAASMPGKIASGVGSLGKFAVSQATGLEPGTIGEIVKSPKTFTKAGQAELTRPNVASEIKSALDAREESLSETGSGYNSMRKATGGVPAMIDVEPTFLKTTIEKTTGTTVDAKGNVSTSGGAMIREPKDVKALQHFYDAWQPIFEQGQMTPNEFLNMRSDLAKLSKFDREITKSGDLEASAKAMRANFNNEYRTQIPGLEDTDATYSSQKTDLEGLRKGILDRDGNLTDAGINKIANASNKTRTVFLDQLEEIKPGITARIKALKAVEDIENAQGNKVGTYGRAVLGGGGMMASIAAGNIPALAGIIATTILASPDIAVPIMRAYGDVKGLKEAVVKQLKKGASSVNQAPQGIGSAASIIPRIKGAPAK